MLNYNHVYYFHVAATEGSLARAADRIGVTQPTMSEQIRQLEKTLEVTLFDRTTSGLRLTDEGRGMYVHTTAMFRAAERIVETLGKMPPDHMPNLRIGISAAVSRSVATDFLMPVLSLEDCLPTVRTSDYASLLQSLRRHDLDLVLAETAPPRSARDSIKIADLHRPRLVVVAGTQTKLDGDWTSLPFIQYSVGSSYRWEVEAYLDERDLHPRLAAETDDTLLMLEAAARTGSVAFVPRSVARDAMVAGRVRLVDTMEPGSATVHALYHDSESADMARRAVALLIEAAASFDS